MSTKRGRDGYDIYTLSELIADPESQVHKREVVVPFIMWKERVTLLAAREKDGKSTFAGAAASAVSSGCPFLGLPTKQRPVIWIGLEEHRAEVVERFIRYGADPEWVFVIDALGEEALSNLEDAVSRLGKLDAPAPAVFIDTLGALVGGEIEDAGSSAAWTPVMQKLLALARPLGASVLLLHHARKSDGTYRDSTAIGANVDVILEMHSVASTNQRKMKPKARWHLDEVVVELNGDTFVLVSGGMPVEEYVFGFIRDNPECSKRAVREGVRASHTEVDAALERLMDESRVENRGDPNHFKLFVIPCPGSEPLREEGRHAQGEIE